MYTLEEIDLLNSLFTFVLKRNGYQQFNAKEYERGVIVIWTRSDITDSTVVRKRSD